MQPAVDSEIRDLLATGIPHSVIGSKLGISRQSVTLAASRLFMQREPRHWDHGTPEYNAWRSMMQRCFNENCQAYHRYGGRGITVFEGWRNYPAFLDAVGRRPTPKHQLERSNNGEGYFPLNVTWATPGEQSRNRRSNQVITFNGRSMPAVAWAEERAMPADLSVLGYVVDGVRKGLCLHQ